MWLSVGLCVSSALSTHPACRCRPDCRTAGPSVAANHRALFHAANTPAKGKLRFPAPVSTGRMSQTSAWSLVGHGSHQQRPAQARQRWMEVGHRHRIIEAINFEAAKRELHPMNVLQYGACALTAKLRQFEPNSNADQYKKII